jgi:hypothetical protein
MLTRYQCSVRHALSLGVVCTVAITAGPLIRAQAGPRDERSALMQQLMDTRPDTGQTVAPVYEGWEPNPDGTVSMYFGYMNRNWKETLDIPVGPNNFFEPSPADRGSRRISCRGATSRHSR